MNDNPAGSPTYEMPQGAQGNPYTFGYGDLLQGFYDVDEAETETLYVHDLAANPAGEGLVEDPENGIIIYNPVADFEGEVELTYKVMDARNGSTDARITFFIVSGMYLITLSTWGYLGKALFVLV